MKIKVVEKCDVEGSERGEKEGLRIIYYNAKGSTLLEALEDFENNFDFDNVHDTYDEFDGACQSSKTIEVSEVDELPKVR